MIAHSDDIFVVIHSDFVANALKEMTPEELRGKQFISAVKGIVPEKNQIITDYLHDQLLVEPDHMAIISGPSHAEETPANRLTYLTVASSNEHWPKSAGLSELPLRKTTYSKDMQGIEYSAV